MAERSGQKVQEVNFQAGYFMEVGLGRLMVGGVYRSGTGAGLYEYAR